MIANNGFLPDGLEEDQVYFTIKGSNANDLKVARTLNDALDGTALTINNTGGELVVVIVYLIRNLVTLDIRFSLIILTNIGLSMLNQGTNNKIYPTFVGVGTTI